MFGGGGKWGEVHFARAHGGDFEAWEATGGGAVSDAFVGWEGRDEGREGWHCWSAEGEGEEKKGVGLSHKEP